MPFDAYSKYYDLLYKNKDYSSEVSYIDSLLKLYGVEKGHLLEIGCGTGKHAHYLSQKGYEITGIDLSQQMVEEAKKNYPSPLLHFSQSSSTEFKFNSTFDAALSLFHVMSYHTTNDMLLSAFRNISSHLKPNAFFLFDFWHGPAVLSDPPTVRIKRMENDSIRVTRLTEIEMHYQKNVVDVHFDVWVENKSTSERQEIQEIHPMRYFFKPELEFMLSCAGLTLTGWIPWMKTDGIPDNKSWYALAIARKTN